MSKSKVGKGKIKDFAWQAWSDRNECTGRSVELEGTLMSRQGSYGGSNVASSHCRTAAREETSWTKPAELISEAGVFIYAVRLRARSCPCLYPLIANQGPRDAGERGSLSGGITPSWLSEELFCGLAKPEQLTCAAAATSLHFHAVNKLAQSPAISALAGSLSRPPGLPYLE